jgi:hypothetical protein
MMTRNLVALGLCLAAATASAAGHKEFSVSRTQTIESKVVKVDQQKREITLRDEDGAETTFKAGEKIRNLAQVKAGDKVTVLLDQSLTLWLLGADEAAPELQVGADVYRAPKGEKPGGITTTDVSGIATVEAIAADKKSVTLKGPRGNVVTLDVRNPANLEGVVVGTRVGFAYSETVGVDVSTPKKAPASKDAKKAAPKADAAKAAPKK